MSQRTKIVLQAALIGAVLGASATRILDIRRLAGVPFFAPDPALHGYRPLLLAAMAGWVLFSLYWEMTAKNSAASKSRESRASRAIHVVLANIAVVLEIVPIRGLGRFIPVFIPVMLAGLAIEAAGLYLTIWARRHLGRYWSGEISIKVEHELIRSGPYRLLRHPIYTGLLAMYAGVAVVTGEWLAAIGLAVAVFAYWRKIRLEEANLEVAFGRDYDASRRTTWALVPGIF